ncbi:MAG: flagella basal body P-ring formation protein FlgA [Spirochaetes bacterium]|nr:flagella basal body P-ring formation protein FlgA [Spirochaetota bacterium]
MYKHVFAIILLTLFIQACFYNYAYCDNRLFLHKSVNYNDEKLCMGDILSINGNTEELNKLRNIEIPPATFSDGYIDIKEISALIKKNTDEIYLIYGNSVRILDPANVNYDIYKSDYLVKAGDRISLHIKKNGINIEMHGIVMEDGRYKDEVNIKLLNKSGHFRKIVKGLVKSKDIVEAAL